MKTAFDMIWKEGRDLQDPKEINELGRRLDIEDIQAALDDDEVKTQLRANTDDALSKGIFGVPTFVMSKVFFWGQDSLGMMLGYLSDPGLFDTPEMRRASILPVGAARPEAQKI